MFICHLFSLFLSSLLVVISLYGPNAFILFISFFNDSSSLWTSHLGEICRKRIQAESQHSRNHTWYTPGFLWIKGCACEWMAIVFTFPPQCIISIGLLSTQRCPLPLCLNHKFSVNIQCLLFSPPSSLHHTPSLISSPYPNNDGSSGHHPTYPVFIVPNKASFFPPLRLCLLLGRAVLNQFFWDLHLLVFLLGIFPSPLQSELY